VSIVAIAMTTLGSIGAVLVLSHVSATIEAFFVWQAGVGLMHAVVLRALAWRLVGTRAVHRFNWSELRRVGGFTVSMSGVAITGMLLMQTDKVVLSRVLTLEAFGQYMLATVVAGGLYLVVTPTFNLIFPKLSALYLKSEHELVAYYRQGTRTLTAVLFPLSTIAIVFARDLMFLWTGDGALSDASAPIVQLILVGTTLNGVMNFPYALQLASGKTRIAITTNIILLVIMLPLTIALSIRFGAIGGAAAWAILNAIYLVVGTWLTHRSLLEDSGARWLAFDVGVPLLATVAVVGSSCVWLSRAALSRPAAIGAALCVSAALAFVLICAHRLRPALELNPAS
jgi:O-antigen/teichoic acid export membrane protein